jgi:hypothetical protein
MDWLISFRSKKALYVAFPSGGPDGKWDILLATSTDGGKKWAYVKVNDDAPCANHMTPTITLDAKTGRTYVAWLENRAGAGRVALAVCEPGGKTCGPNQSVSETPFASYSFARHSPRWLGEYFALVIDAKRRKLHAVWTQTVDEGGKAIGRIFHAEAKLP